MASALSLTDRDMRQILTQSKEIARKAEHPSANRSAAHWMPTANSFLAHLRYPGERQLLRDHLVRASAIISRLPARIGVHRAEVFQLSSDPLLIDKVRDIVGLYLDSPHEALVLCVDEESQIQALSLTQPVLPMRVGKLDRRTHDYKRHGVASLFAALDIATGHVLGKCYRRHRSIEPLDFLKKIDAAVPSDLDVRLELDNYGTHKPALIRRWLQKRTRYQLHFTPTHA